MLKYIFKKNYISIQFAISSIFYHFGGTKVVYIEIDHQLYIHYTCICIVYLYIYYMQAAIMRDNERVQSGSILCT